MTSRQIKTSRPKWQPKHSKAYGRSSDRDKPKDMCMLTYGDKTNFPTWKEQMRTEIALQFGDLVTIIDSGQLFDPADIDTDDYDETDDPHGLKLHRLKMQLTNRERHIQAQELLHPKCHALMWKYMSRESMEAVLGHADYDEDTHRNDPLQLYLSIKATHTVGGGAADATTRRARTRQAYKSVVQGPYEDQVEYKHRFSYLLEAAKAQQLGT